MTSIPEASVEISEKTCTKCNARKPLEEFHRKSTGKLGRAPHCKECVSKQKAIHYSANSDRLKADKREYYRNNTPKILERNKKWADRNPEYITDYQRARRKSHAEYISDYMRIYQKLNIDKWIMDSHRRRADSGESSLSRSEVIARWGEFCYLGGDRVAENGNPLKNFHLEHVVPLSKGGSHTIDNLRPSCAHHNLSKGGKVLITYLAWRTSLQLRSGELVITDADHDWYAEHCREIEPLNT